MDMDEETKITEFDYENYIDPVLLKDVDTNDPDFKNLIRALNFFSRTQYEKL